MKFVTIARNGTTSVGRLADDDSSVELLANGSGKTFSTLADLICSQEDVEPTGEVFALEDTVIKAPIPRPARNIFCVGKNYADHAVEFTDSGFDSSKQENAVPSAPIVFSKVPECVIAHRDQVRVDPKVSDCIDYEAELCVIIGRQGRSISKKDAMNYVWGYTIVNDITSRDLQKVHSQWLIGKSLDTFCPMGPVAVSKDDVDLNNTALNCWVNDELRQSANTIDLVFDVPTLIETLSAGITLYPGDLIATGTPAGVGVGFSPPKYLKPGDIVRIEIDNIGVLENRIVNWDD